MKKHKLIIYELISRRLRGRLLLGALVLAVLAIIDLFRPIFGSYWYLVWIAAAVLLLLWFYYGVLMRRASIQIGEKFLRLQGPLRGFNMSYGRIDTIAATTMAHHYPKDTLTRRERKLFAPLYQQTVILAQMDNYPKKMRRPRLWFVPYIFGKSQPGLLLAVQDWMQLSRDLEVARTHWHERRSGRNREDKRSLASQILDY